MLVSVLRGLTLSVVAIAACGSGTYLDDASVRRRALEDELVNPNNGYSRLRLEHYGKDWEALPVRDGGIAIEGRDLRAIGEDAFFRYPVQQPPSVAFGLQHLASNGMMTCATCHSKNDVPGIANSDLNIGFGPGRVDVTTHDGSEPVKIPDLRPIRFQTFLHATASVRNIDETTLAVRIETLIIVSSSQTIRPPREVALGLAIYLRSLADDLPTPGTNATFEASCARCHATSAFTGSPVPLAVVGTDPKVGMSADRGTGNYRVPSLRGVGTRGPLLHDASVPSIEKMLDPARTNGHPFGLDLDEAARADLIAYLRTL